MFIFIYLKRGAVWKGICWRKKEHNHSKWARNISLLEFLCIMAILFYVLCIIAIFLQNCEKHLSIPF